MNMDGMKKAQDIIAKSPVSGHRYSIIGALCQKEFLAPMVLKITSQVIETKARKKLLPNLKKGQVIRHG